MVSCLREKGAELDSAAGSRVTASLGRPTSDIQRLRGELPGCSSLVWVPAKYFCAVSCIPEARNKKRDPQVFAPSQPQAIDNLIFPTAFQSHESADGCKLDNAAQAIQFFILITRIMIIISHSSFTSQSMNQSRSDENDHKVISQSAWCVRGRACPAAALAIEEDKDEDADVEGRNPGRSPGRSEQAF